MKEITIDTKMITLIGDPLVQSFAARMQNAGYEAANLNLCYFYTVAGKEHLKEIVEGIRYMNFAGFAVTKPNKIEILKYLDRLDPLCEMIGSCNTVVKEEDGTLTGYNTDALGFYASFCQSYSHPLQDSDVFCFGAGGVGRAICMILAQHQVHRLYIFDPDSENAENLVSQINDYFPERAVLVNDTKAVQDCQVVINASGIGMGKTVGKSPLDSSQMLEHQFCYDACYNPLETQFLMDAKKKGCTICNGLDMSLYQGAAQIELWTQCQAPLERMRKELEIILSEYD